MPNCQLQIFEQPQDYSNILKKMQNFTKNRSDSTIDQIWLLQHLPVYTYGAHTNPKLPPESLGIKLIKSDRGGNITYHAPGQIIMYPLIDTKRLSYSVHGMVSRLEQLVMTILELYHIQPKLIPERRGVYVNDAKIAAIGLRFRKYCSYHGLALNVDLDLKPFDAIEPCGYKQKTTNMKKCGANVSISDIMNLMVKLIPDFFEVKFI